MYGSCVLVESTRLWHGSLYHFLMKLFVFSKLSLPVLHHLFYVHVASESEFFGLVLHYCLILSINKQHFVTSLSSFYFLKFLESIWSNFRLSLLFLNLFLLFLMFYSFMCENPMLYLLGGIDIDFTGLQKYSFLLEHFLFGLFFGVQLSILYDVRRFFYHLVFFFSNSN